MDYSEFFNTNVAEQNENETEQQNMPESAYDMTIGDVKTVFERLNGWEDTGYSNVTISYQSFAMEDDENAPSRNQIFTTTKAAIQLCFDTHIPGYFGLDIIFRSANEPELKLLWGRLQQFRRNIATHPDKEWIFFFNLLENSTITMQTDTEDVPFVVRAFNPLMFYLTREVPEMQVDDVQTADGEMVGGNIIRMVIPAQFVQFEYCKNADTLGLKGEVLTEEEDARFKNTQMSNESEW